MPNPEPGDKRAPIVHDQALTTNVGVRSSVTGTVERGLNDTRLAVLGILVAIGLTVGFGMQCAWWVRVVAGLGSFVLACALIKWGRSRHYLMAFVHWLTDR